MYISCLDIGFKGFITKVESSNRSEHLKFDISVYEGLEGLKRNLHKILSFTVESINNSTGEIESMTFDGLANYHEINGNLLLGVNLTSGIALTLRS